MADQDGSLGVQILPPGAVELTKHLEQGKIDDLQQRVLVLCREKDFLRKRLDKAEKDTHEFVNYFQKEIEKKDLKVKELTEQQQRTDLTAKQSIRAINDETSEKIRKIKAEADSVKIDLTNSLQSAQEEIHKLNHFREIKDSVDVHVKQLEETIGSLQKKATEDLNNQERKFLGEKSKMQKDMAKRTEAIKKEARIEAQAGLDSETKKIVTDNRRMGEELRFQLQMMSELQAEKAKRRRRSTRGRASRANENHALSNKVMALEEALLSGTKKFNEDRNKIKSSVAKELEDVTMDANGLRHLITLKNKELSHIKKLAQTILDQRGEVEQFFLESIEQVKEKIVSERDQKYKKSLVEYNKKMREATAMGGENGGGKFPSIRGRNLSFLEPAAPSSLPINPGKKVDITELSWEDRERVLRILFAKINNVQGRVETLPRHALEEVRGGSNPEPPPPGSRSGYR
ncbi:hypothetical protein TrRE_jg8671 [Triparma retinervis]|uniref:Coiled-coil domain-containing protein 176 n=1 Tax=Triparma retinervis TaxID=2557542 RepID=A0A9W7FW94_9STRA|nr:hypothetical protein TrRE_jg8671 [Triparma retinervis]